MKVLVVLVNNGWVNILYLMKEIIYVNLVELYKDLLFYENIIGVLECFWNVVKFGMYNVINVGNGIGKKVGGLFYCVVGKLGIV